MKRIILITLLAFAVLFAGLHFFQLQKEKPKYKTERIERRTITTQVEASGIIKPVKTVNIGAQVSGQIKEIYVDYNSEVKKGQLLAQIDPSLFEAQVQKAQGDLLAAQANYSQVKSVLDFQQKNYQRYQNLYKKNYVSKSDLDLAKSDYYSNLARLNAQSAQISQAKANLDNAVTNLGYCKIVSPVDGVVITRSVDVGQTVASSFQTPTLFEVAQDLTKMQIEVNVSEADIGKVKEGQKAEYTLDGYPDKIFEGSISQVRISPTTVSNVVTYSVIVSVDNVDNILKPGMTANVSIITGRSENVLSVSSSALKFTLDNLTGGKKYETQGIWIMKNKTPVRIDIKTGIKNLDFAEIISEKLNEGDEVITGIIDKKKKTRGHRPPGMF